MKRTILIAGYTKTAYLKKIRRYFTGEQITLACAYTRLPTTDIKQRYLTYFDDTYNLNEESDVKKLESLRDSIAVITCTQERDMVAYIKAQLYCKKISEEQARKYKKLINKHSFKTELSKLHPELVPAVRVVNDELIESLETLSYPQVIKPSGLAGSIMVHVVHSPEEFKDYYAEYGPQMKDIATQYYGKQIETITEDYVSGPQYSINTYIDATGMVTLCPIIRVVPPQELGINDTYNVFQYTTEEIQGEALTLLKDSIQKIVDYFEIRNTSAHFDSVLDNGQWKFFEVGLRIGGNRQKIYKLSHHMDHLYNDIVNRLGSDVETIPARKKTVCVVQKASEETGVLQSVSYKRTGKTETPALIKELKIAKIGSEVKPLSHGGATITRHLVSNKNEQEALNTSKELFDSIKFEIK